ncbi:hypothetical protein FHU38_003466 [Saccharomonospora amisosensis]|uniref:Subtilisin inhibitor domain-containing protein n=1 Tax=Saccharomonospora amisosensis TaxID=1128677 RepID=A0A7X5ZRR6_9PSEU|nr:hypothetical protein [Saccharomonospora amisosensis]
MSMIAAGSLAACTLTALCAGGLALPAESSLSLSLRGTDGVTRSVHLTCEPDAGTHPRAQQACAALDAADGDFDRLPALQRQCTMIYSPVRAEARGHWQGEPVRFTTEYSNPCFAGARSGGVFGF